MRPGVDVITLSQPPPRSAPTYTGAWFAVGKAGTVPNPNIPVEVRSMKQYEDTFGARTGGAVLYDSIDAFFREGGSRVYVSATTTASPTPTEWTDALAKFSKGYGPGQVSIPGITDTTVQTALLQHAQDNNRVGILDGVETPTAAQLTTRAGTLRADGRYGALFGPWAIYPGIAGGTDRHIPYSAVQAGIIARNDGTGNAGVAAAGQQGRSVVATGLTAYYTDAEYTSLNDAGVNMAKLIYGEVQTYGYRSVADPATPDGDNWMSFGWSRLNMQISAQAGAIGERYVFRTIDARGLTIGGFGAELRAMLNQFYLANALYGETPEDAFDVDVGPQVNTLERIAAGELHAVIRVRMSPFAEWVVIEIVKVLTSESVAVAA